MISQLNEKSMMARALPLWLVVQRTLMTESQPLTLTMCTPAEHQYQASKRVNPHDNCTLLATQTAAAPSLSITTGQHREPASPATE